MKIRFFAFFSAVAILAFCIVPAFAAGTEKDILDYAQVSVDGFTKVVTITFPANGYDITAWENGWAYETTPLFTHKGNSATFDFTGINAGVRPRRIVLTLAPLGQPIIPYRSQAYNGIYLDVSEIPSSAVCSVDVAFYANEVDVNASRTVEMFFLAGRYNDGGTYSTGEKLKMTLQHPESNIWLGHYDWTIGDNSKFYIPEVYATVDSSTDLTGRWEFAVDNFSIITTIDALKELEKNTGETNNLLREALDKLDEITDREPEPDVPGWNDGAEDVEDQEQDILDQLDPDGVQDDLADMQLSILDYVILYVSAFAAISAIFNYFMEFPLITLLLYLSLVLGLLASLLGIGLAVGRKVDRASRRSSGKKGRS